MKVIKWKRLPPPPKPQGPPLDYHVLLEPANFHTDYLRATLRPSGEVLAIARDIEPQVCRELVARGATPGSRLFTYWPGKAYWASRWDVHRAAKLYSSDWGFGTYKPMQKVEGEGTPGSTSGNACSERADGDLEPAGA